jgi:prepilin-type N-terminal cleavage/methylation domain-containing protein
MKRAFTLIELLVVIAIIAILAAILFPVFAQAKESAKNTQTISNMKQTATAALLYSADYEDFLPLSQGADNFTYYMWQDAIQPYTKNYDLLLHPKRQRPTGTAANIAWKRVQYVGGFPTAASNAGAAVRTQGFYTWTNATWTGGVPVRFDGLMGHGGPTAAWYGQVQSPSRSQSAVNNVADMAMFSEAANWDNWWSFSDGTNSYAFLYVVKWTPEADWSSYSGNWGFAGPLALTRPLNGASGINPNPTRPNGLGTIAFADSHVKPTDHRGGVYQRVDIGGGVFALRHFWPN